MILTTDMYVPALRWRQAEYQALFRLTDEAKDRTVPYITIPDIEYDFEEKRAKKSLQEHVHPFATRYKAKWGTRPAWIAVNKEIVGSAMDDGRDVFTYVFAALRGNGAAAAPAIPLDANPSVVAAVKSICKVDGRGVGFSIRLEDLMKPGIGQRIAALASTLRTPLEEVDLLLDLGAPNFEPYGVLATALIAALQKLGDLGRFRNFVLIGTAIPETFKDVAKGEDRIPRHDWMWYREFTSKLPSNIRSPNYGDYTIVHPEFAAIDMRMVKPAGKLVYTTATSWEVRKGGAFRDNMDQMHDHCASIVKSGKFMSPKFSSGDEFIAKCATREEGHSSQGKWKEVAINHHIMQVLHDLATLASAA